MHIRKLDALLPASGSPQSSRRSVLQQAYIAPEPASAATGRLFESEPHRGSRHSPYPVPVRGHRANEPNNVDQPCLPVLSSNPLLAPEVEQLVQAPRERQNAQEPLPSAPGRENDSAPRHMWYYQEPECQEVAPVAPRNTGRLDGRVSFDPLNAQLVPAPGLFPDAASNCPLPNQIPDVEERRATLQERLARQKKIYGIVCELGRRHIKLYEIKKRKLHVIRNNFDEQPRLYDYIRVVENDFQPADYKEEHSGIRHISTRTGLILTWATSPNDEELAQMSESARAKYEGKLWSPYLGYLNDPRQVFKPQSHNGKEVRICAVYAPTGTSHFRLLNITGEIKGEERSLRTPWMKVINGEVDPDDYDFEIPRKTFRRVKHLGTEHAVCIARKVRNPNYNKMNTRSREHCNVFFNRMHGIYRCLKSARLGRWYMHSSSDDRKKEKYRHLSLYKSVTVSTKEEVEAPVRTEVLRHGVLQMTVKFNIKNLDRFDFFWDKFVGKVEVDPTMCTRILDQIQIRLNEAPCDDGPKGRAACENRVKNGVTIRARVNTHGADLLEIAEQYPTRGAFILVRVTSIKFKDNNETIFRA